MIRMKRKVEAMEEALRAGGLAVPEDVPPGEDSTVAERLRYAIEAKGISIREFQRLLQAKGVRGRSYPAVHSYLKAEGGTEPSLAFLDAAAEVLGFAPGWLAFGIGSATLGG